MTSPLAAAQELDPQVVRQAAAWMARLWSGEASEAEVQACASWRAAHPQHEQAWHRLQMFEQRFDSVPRAVARRVLQQQDEASVSARRRALQVLGLGVVTGAGVAWGVADPPAWRRALAEHRTATGEIRALRLADGSDAMLASASALDVRFDDNERLLLLRAGEILVQTAADSAPRPRPLSVRTAEGDFEALGTRFIVRRLGDASRISVLEGTVEVRPALGGRPLRVNAGQAAECSAAAAHLLGPVTEATAAWARGLLVADEMSLADLVAEFARYRSGWLRCDPRVAALRVSGVFPLRDTDRALHNLALALPVTVERRTDYWVVVRPR